MVEDVWYDTQKTRFGQLPCVHVFSEYHKSKACPNQRMFSRMYVVANADSIQKVELGIIVVLVLDRQFLLTLLELPITTSPVTTEKTFLATSLLLLGK